MVDDDTLVELWRRCLKDPSTSDAVIRSLSRLALLRYEDFRLQLIAWSLDPPASSRPNSAAMTSQLQHHERSLAKIEPSRSNAQSAARATSFYWTTIRRIGSRTALNATRRSAPCWAAPSIPCSQQSIEFALLVCNAARASWPRRGSVIGNWARPRGELPRIYDFEARTSKD
jgi:hypothetical protein